MFGRLVWCKDAFVLVPTWQVAKVLVFGEEMRILIMVRNWSLGCRFCL